MINITMIIFYNRKSNLDSHKMVHIDAKHNKYDQSEQSYIYFKTSFESSYKREAHR